MHESIIIITVNIIMWHIGAGTLFFYAIKYVVIHLQLYGRL